MTAPLATGFPDFVRQTSEAQVLEINDVNVNIAHSFQYPVKYIGNAKSLHLWAKPPTHGMRLEIAYAADAAGFTISDVYNVHMSSGDVAKQPIPILGPYLFMSVFHSDASTNNVTIELWRTPTDVRFAGAIGDITVFSQDNQPIGASATITLDSPNVMEAPATWAVSVGGGNYTAKIEAVDFQNNVTLLDFVNGSGPLQTPRPVYLPPWHIRAVITNNTTSAQSYTLAMTRRHNR